MTLKEIKEKLKTEVDSNLSMLAHRGWGSDERYFEVISIHEYDTKQDFEDKEEQPVECFYDIYLDFEQEGYSRQKLTIAQVKLEDFNKWLEKANSRHHYRFSFECGNDHGADMYELELIGVDENYVVFENIGWWNE